MGLRGPGAKPKRHTEEIEKPKRKRSLPWQKKGLSRADRVIAFLEFLPVTKGIKAGKRMKLLDRQKAFIRDVYTEKSRVRIAIDSAPRGNGKTGMTAGLALCTLLGPEAEPRGEVYSAAVDRTQSAKIFSEMEAIIFAVDEFKDRCNVKRHEKRIEVLEGEGAGSIYEAMSADGRKGNSLAPSLWIYDELAQVNDFELLDNLETALGKRTRSLGLIISTQAESDDHRLSQMIDDGLTTVDPSIVVHLLSAPKDADPFDEKTIAAVNPAFDVYLSREDVMAEARKAQRMKVFEPQFRNKRLNQRVDFGADRRIVPASEWKECKGEIDLKSLKGRKCFGGLDLSGQKDLTALVLVFPSDDKLPVYTVLPVFWTPLGYLSQRQAKEQELFRAWIEEEHMIGIEGPIVNYHHVAEDISALAGEYDIQAIAFDPARMNLLRPELEEFGVEIPFEKHQQGFISMGPVVDLLAEMVLTRRLIHNNPVLTSNMANAIVVSDAAGNLKIDKGRSNDRSPVRVDGAVCLAMALGIASTWETPEAPPDLSFLSKPIW
jgi:phage terminase large subunit-like protein